MTSTELIKRFQLPEDAAKDLQQEILLKSKVAGPLRLGGASLQPIQLTFINETSSETKKKLEPKYNYNGRYVCEALSVADCDYNNEGIFDGQILVWIPALKSFASWDSEHEQSYVFTDVTWEDIKRDPIKYLCTQWNPIEWYEHIWDICSLWEHFPFLFFAGNFFYEPLKQIEKEFANGAVENVITSCDRLLEESKKPMLGTEELIKIKVKILCFRSVSNYLLNKTDFAINDFQNAISLAREYDKIKIYENHPDWFIEDAHQKFSIIMSDILEKRFELMQTFITELLKRNDDQALFFANWATNTYPQKINEIIPSVNTIDAPGELLETVKEILSVRLSEYEEAKKVATRMYETLSEGNSSLLIDELNKITIKNWGLDIFASYISTVINNALINNLKKGNISEGRELIETYATKLDIIEPAQIEFQELFANTLCVISNDSQENRDFYSLLQKYYLKRIRVHGDVLIGNERLARNLACVNITLKDIETGYFFLKKALILKAKKEAIINEKDFDPIRNEDRFINLLKRYYPNYPD